MTIVIGRRHWFGCLNELRERGHGRHESGCFLLGATHGKKGKVQKVVYYDELDPKAYSSGVCVLQGDAFTRLWELCRADSVSVVADVHTHPGEAPPKRG